MLNLFAKIVKRCKDDGINYTTLLNEKLNQECLTYRVMSHKCRDKKPYRLYQTSQAAATNLFMALRLYIELDLI